MDSYTNQVVIGLTRSSPEHLRVPAFSRHPGAETAQSFRDAPNSVLFLTVVVLTNLDADDRREST
jgi:hypothetical protein